MNSVLLVFFFFLFVLANMFSTFSIRLLFTFTEVSIKLIVLMAITSLSRPSYQFTGIIRRFPLPEGGFASPTPSPSLSIPFRWQIRMCFTHKRSINAISMVNAKNTLFRFAIVAVTLVVVVVAV